MLRRTLLSSLLQTALLGAAGGIGFAPGRVKQPPETMLGLRPSKSVRPIW